MLSPASCKWLASCEPSLEVSPSITEAELETLALADESVVRALEGRGVRKLVIRAPKLVNVVPE